MVDVDIVWMNRLGILLNFAAGFLMAPDLIGREYLTKVERHLKRILLHSRRRTRRVILWFERRYHIATITTGRRRSFVLATALMAIMSWGAFWVLSIAYALYAQPPVWQILVYITAALAGAILVHRVAIAVSLSDGKWQETGIGKPLSLLIFMFGNAVLAIPFGILIGLGALLLYIAPVILSVAAGLTLRRLRGNERLLKAMLVVGIVSFVLGNMLQLLATRR